MRRSVVLAAAHAARNHSDSSENEVNEKRPASIESDPSDILGYNVSSNASGSDKSGHFETDLHGHVNILLGGAMLSGMIMVLIVICYCCHKNMKKYRPQEYSQYWRTEPDVHSLEVFTMDAHIACPELVATTNPEDGTQAALPCPLTPGPPPAYESLIFDPQSLAISNDKKGNAEIPANEPTLNEDSTTLDLDAGQAKNEEDGRDERDLPSYEAALKLEADGYV